MKIFYLFLLAAIISIQCSCNGVETKNSTQKDTATHAGLLDTVSEQIISINRDALTKDFITWYNYTYYNVRLSQSFIGLGIDSIKIDKSVFLNKLMTENVLPFKTKIVKGQPVYQLFKLNAGDENIKITIQQMAANEMEHFKMEGTEMPAFNFTDLNGKKYNNTSAKGKIVVLKCWFIHCVACVKEFPELNKLVDEYNGKDDLLFVSLATDTKKDLEKFFATKLFKYATVPDMENYMVNKLKITQYPTHLLIDRNGKIVKVVNNIEDLLPFIKIETDKNRQ